MNFIKMKSLTLEKYIDEINLYGFCLIEDLITNDIINYLSNKYSELHEYPAKHKEYFINDNDNLYQTLFGILNLDQQCSELITNRYLNEILKRFLGDNYRLGEACSKIAYPGAKEGVFHTDSTAELIKPFPKNPWLLNTMWMLTDFTKKNGATMLVPFSHKSCTNPSKYFSSKFNYHKYVEGKKGSLIIWQGGVWHANGANTTKNKKRIGLNASYSPSWWNLKREQGHQPILEENFMKLPDNLKMIIKHKIGKNRNEYYD